MNAGPLIRTLALTRRAAVRLAERTDHGALNRLPASCGRGATLGAGGCSCARRRAELKGCQRGEAVQRLVDCVKSRWRAPTQPSEPSQTAAGVAPGQHDTCRRITAHVSLQLSRVRVSPPQFKIHVRRLCLFAPPVPSSHQQRPDSTR